MLESQVLSTQRNKGNTTTPSLFVQNEQNGAYDLLNRQGFEGNSRSFGSDSNSDEIPNIQAYINNLKADCHSLKAKNSQLNSKVQELEVLSIF